MSHLIAYESLSRTLSLSKWLQGDGGVGFKEVGQLQKLPGILSFQSFE